MQSNVIFFTGILFSFYNLICNVTLLRPSSAVLKFLPPLNASITFPYHVSFYFLYYSDLSQVHLVYIVYYCISKDGIICQKLSLNRHAEKVMVGEVLEDKGHLSVFISTGN